MEFISFKRELTPSEKGGPGLAWYAFSPRPDERAEVVATLDGVYKAHRVPTTWVVQDDWTLYCNTCSATVERYVTYTASLLNGTPVPNTPICEVPDMTGRNCSQAQPGFNSNQCGIDDAQTDANGNFTGQWSLNSDSYTPVGCRFQNAEGIRAAEIGQPIQ